MLKRSYPDLKQAIESERLRIRAIKDRGTYGTEYLRIITPDFVTKYKSTALIELSRDLALDHSSEATRARTIIEGELAIRKEQTLWQSQRDNVALVVAIGSLIAAIWYLD